MSATRAREILERIEQLSDPTPERIRSMAAHAAAAAAVDAATSARITMLLALLEHPDRTTGLLTDAEAAIVVRNIRTALGLPPTTNPEEPA